MKIGDELGHDVPQMRLAQHDEWSDDTGGDSPIRGWLSFAEFFELAQNAGVAPASLLGEHQHEFPDVLGRPRTPLLPFLAGSFRPVSESALFGPARSLWRPLRGDRRLGRRGPPPSSVAGSFSAAILDPPAVFGNAVFSPE